MKKITVCLALLLSACAAPHQITNRADFLAEATRTYKVPREKVIQAAETILKISDPQDFDFRHNQSGFVGMRRYFVYAVLASASGQERWEISTEETKEGVRVSLGVTDVGQTHGQGGQRYDGKLGSVHLYRLFWKRMDYMLGKSQVWVSCQDASQEIEAGGTNAMSALEGLCGSTSDGRHAPAPEPIIGAK